MKKLIIATILLTLISTAGAAFAVDDAVVEAIDEKAAAANSKADGNNSRIQALELKDIIIEKKVLDNESLKATKDELGGVKELVDIELLTKATKDELGGVKKLVDIELLKKATKNELGLVDEKKADKEYVETELLKKATKDELGGVKELVDIELLKKATKDELELVEKDVLKKAEKTEVDAKLLEKADMVALELVKEDVLKKAEIVYVDQKAQAIALEERVFALEADLATALSTIGQLQAALAAEETARKVATNDLQVQIDVLDSSALQARIVAIEGNTVLELNGYLSLDDSGINKTALFSDVNVQLVNGGGTTDSTNGLGNLIVGYNSTPAGLLDVTRDGSHNIIIGDGHEYREHSELEVTSIVATPATLNIVSAGNIDLIAGLDLNLDVGQNANLQVGMDASFQIAKTLNLTMEDLNLDVAQDATMMVGRDLALNVAGDTNLLLQDLFLNARRVEFDLTNEFLIRASKINLRSRGDIILKGTKIEEPNIPNP